MASSRSEADDVGAEQPDGARSVALTPRLRSPRAERQARAAGCRASVAVAGISTRLAGHRSARPTDHLGIVSARAQRSARNGPIGPAKSGSTVMTNGARETARYRKPQLVAEARAIRWSEIDLIADTEPVGFAFESAECRGSGPRATRVSRRRRAPAWMKGEQAESSADRREWEPSPRIIGDSDTAAHLSTASRMAR